MNQQLIRARGFVATIQQAANEAEFMCGQVLTIDGHGSLLAKLFAVETAAKMARELITDSMKRALQEQSKVVERGAAT